MFVILNLPILRGALKPFTRLIVGLIAIPIFRFILKRIFRLHTLDKELEKDLEEWFRGALLLLAATANMEHLLFWWVQNVDWLDRADWFTMGLRLMLAIGVIEAMPDQELFAVMHPGPPKLQKGENVFRQLWKKKWKFLKGIGCRHLNRSSPVLAMMCAIVGSQLPSANEYREDIARHDFIMSWSCSEQCCTVSPFLSLASTVQIRNIEPEIVAMKKEFGQFDRRRERWMVGWVCYLLAITQYLIIGLVTRRDKALEMLSEFDRAVAERRQELVQEFVDDGNLPEDFDANAPLPEQLPTTTITVRPEDGTAL
ncbi:MAG: hypothetical protein O2856_14800 [Planctomycetota bacterium]|nr:hypothetical protein [Planctomycetota bacterium]